MRGDARVDRRGHSPENGSTRTARREQLDENSSTRTARKERRKIGLVGFMNGIVGRVARVGLGLALIAWGLSSLGGTIGLIVALVGLLPIALGLWGRCLLELAAPSPASRQA